MLLGLYAIIVTIFAQQIADYGIKLQGPLVFLAFLLTGTAWFWARIRNSIVNRLANHLINLLSENKQSLLSFRRRIENEDQLFNWVRENYPHFASRLVVNAAIQIKKK